MFAIRYISVYVLFRLLCPDKSHVSLDKTSKGSTHLNFGKNHNAHMTSAIQKMIVLGKAGHV